ncbi:hypothetical protein BO78DRAFT_32042 [Aspergillus sclerotiicarbonarius CBS 121057]|uniref:Uncharacterized protein n=1 Tax=Aspergillus sclerotiicarbonarius (strain CBS 121057 / IBT 28362) TaxID=1448318 RepID=A0A319EH65_ASPSB|nr:hypothetical protein BO78DRAFT_32042 [Aspergillus sclerotiicarbonarius CBS 121057]
MQTRHQAAQPPKQAAYNQSSNPVDRTPYEQRVPQHQTRQRGDPISSITRNANSHPSNDEALRRLNAEREQEQRAMQNASDVDTEYGVEQQPAEGDIAHAVEGKSAEARARAQAGAHAGPVGSAMGPGDPGYEKGEAADLDRKREAHDQMLGDRVGQSPPEPDGETVERGALRERKLRQDRELDVQGAVSEGSGGAVVG